MSRSEESLALLVALVPYLLDRGSVTVAEAAKHFEVPEAEIRAGVHLLAMSGIPDSQGNVYANDMFDIAWDAFEDHDVIELTQLVALEASPRLGAREASALIAGLELIRRMPGHGDREALASLQQKLRRAATGHRPGLAIEPREESTFAATIRSAIEMGEVLEIEYRKPGAPTAKRRIVPARLEFVDEAAFVRAWDLERDAARSFRLDRIESASLTGEPAPAGVGVAPEAPVVAAGDGAIEVQLIASDAGAALLTEYLDGEPSRRPDGRLDAVIRATQLGAVIRAVASLGGEAVIIAPPIARQTMVELATRARAAYADAGEQAR